MPAMTCQKKTVSLLLALLQPSQLSSCFSTTSSVLGGCLTSGQVEGASTVQSLPLLWQEV
jgi:hypothetical protein